MKNKRIITTAITVVVMSFLLLSCIRKKTEVIAAVENRKEIPTLHVDEVTTLISDSGVTRYRLTAPAWDVYDKADTAYWEFPLGVRLERFNTDMLVDANIRADYAKYFEKDEFWALRGNVDATNLEGKRFQSERFFWNQKKEVIYSDTLVKITEGSDTIYGVNFVSDQTLTKFTIKQATGEFLMSDE